MGGGVYLAPPPSLKYGGDNCVLLFLGIHKEGGGGVFPRFLFFLEGEKRAVLSGEGGPWGKSPYLFGKKPPLAGRTHLGVFFTLGGQVVKKGKPSFLAPPPGENFCVLGGVFFWVGPVAPRRPRTGVVWDQTGGGAQFFEKTKFSLRKGTQRVDFPVTSPQHLIPQAEDLPALFGKRGGGVFTGRVEFLDGADLAYMSLLSGPEEIENARDESRRPLFSKKFPVSPPAATPQALFSLCFRNGYFPAQLYIHGMPQLAASEYCNLWSRGTRVPIECLVHDAVLSCFYCWSPELCTNEPGDLNYDTLAVVTSMLAFCITWPTREA